MTENNSRKVAYITDFNRLQEIIERIESKFKNSILGYCLICGEESSKKIRYDKECTLTINQFIKEANQRIPETALKDSKLTYYTETTSDLEKKTPTKKEFMVKGYTKQNVEKFSSKHFPKFKGTLCKECKNNFLEKAEKCFQIIHTGENIKEIYTSMKMCHSNYLDLLDFYFEFTDK